MAAPSSCWARARSRLLWRCSPLLASPTPMPWPQVAVTPPALRPRHSRPPPLPPPTSPPLGPRLLRTALWAPLSHRHRSWRSRRRLRTFPRAPAPRLRRHRPLPRLASRLCSRCGCKRRAMTRCPPPLLLPQHSRRRRLLQQHRHLLLLLLPPLLCPVAPPRSCHRQLTTPRASPRSPLLARVLSPWLRGRPVGSSRCRASRCSRRWVTLPWTHSMHNQPVSPQSPAT
mmetsp:Transcript_11857/g.27247  ORF Transcript_11857/g.27247 Transcript_11857/m.27247 type:complete len:228 (+) Transcript_11857:409-1092(+)